MDLGLHGKVAMVAGASSGLGLGVATWLAREGADIAICARDRDRVHAAADLISDHTSGSVHAASCDLRDASEVERWVADTVARFGAIHIIVANAGGPPPGPAGDFDLEAHRAALDLCLLSQIGFVRASLPHIRAAGWGRVLLVASETVGRPTSRYGLSSVARAGLVGFAGSLAQELGAGQITVNVLAPGYHRTPPVERMAATSSTSPEAGAEELTCHIPLQRMGSADDFGAVAAFVASEHAGFMTGGVIFVDGGASLGPR